MERISLTTRSSALVAALVAALLALTLAPAGASAACPTSDGYSGQAGGVQVDITGCGAVAPATQTHADAGDDVVDAAATGAVPAASAQPAVARPGMSSLPFTGADLARFLAGGLVLICVGLAFRLAAGPKKRAAARSH
jgi:hypothetical protein